MLTQYQSILIKSAIFLATLVLFTWGLGSQEIISFNSRFYLFAREMQQFGAGWFPTTYQQPYPDYLASSTWLISLVASLMGGLNKMTAVLPTAIMGALTVTLTYSIGALRDRRWGVYAALLLLLTVSFLTSGRGISLDMYTTAICTAVFYLLCKGIGEIWIFFLLISSFVFRGPIGFVMPTGIACVYYFLMGNYRKCFVFGLRALILLLLCSGLLLLLAYQTGGDHFMQRVLTMQVTGRLHNYHLPHYFYFIAGLRTYAPAYILACASAAGALYYALKNREPGLDGKFLLQLSGWMLVILIGMSIPDDKKIRYILPMAPAAALIAAWLFVAPREQKYFQWARELVLYLLGLLPLILLCLFAFNPLRFNAPPFQQIHLANIKLFLVIMQSLIILALWLPRKYYAGCVLSVAVVCFAGANYLVIEPSELYSNRALAFVTRIETLRMERHAQLVFYRENPDGLPIKYVVNMPRLQKPVFIYHEQDLDQIRGPAFFVTSVENISPKTLSHYHIIAKDSLGHVPVIVFSREPT